MFRHIMVAIGLFAFILIFVILGGNGEVISKCEQAGGAWVKARPSDSVKRVNGYVCISRSAIIEIE